ncbi:hypothetical protein IWZ00DRAFT_545738 [Phyllosticta capitalensis]
MPPLIRAEDWELAGDEVSVPYMKEYTTYFDDLVAKVEADKVQWVGRDLVPFSRPTAKQVLVKYDAEWRQSRAKEDCQPVIYANYLTDDYGQPPEQGHAATILDFMED